MIDVFAGTGALGLEAISRGAAFASFIENDASALAVLRANIAKLRFQSSAAVLAADATTLVHWRMRQPVLSLPMRPIKPGAALWLLTLWPRLVRLVMRGGHHRNRKNRNNGQQLACRWPDAD